MALVIHAFDGARRQRSDPAFRKSALLTRDLCILCMYNELRPPQPPCMQAPIFVSCFACVCLCSFIFALFASASAVLLFCRFFFFLFFVFRCARGTFLSEGIMAPGATHIFYIYLYHNISFYGLHSGHADHDGSGGAPLWRYVIIPFGWAVILQAAIFFFIFFIFVC